MTASSTIAAHMPSAPNSSSGLRPLRSMSRIAGSVISMLSRPIPTFARIAPFEPKPMSVSRVGA